MAQLLVLILILIVLLSNITVAALRTTQFSTVNTNNPTERFATKSIRHIEPVLKFQLNHHNYYGNIDSTRSRFDTTAVEDNPIDEQNTEQRINIPTQSSTAPSISLSFSAYESQFEYSLTEINNLYSPDSRTTVYGENDEIIEQYNNHPSYSTTGSTAAGDGPRTGAAYWSQLDNNNWATATIRADGSIHAVINENNEIYEIDRADHLHRTNELDPTSTTSNRLFTALSAEDQQLIIFKHSDYIDSNKTHQCRAIPNPNKVHHQDNPQNNPDNSNNPDIGEFIDNDIGRHRSLLSVNSWSNCYPGDSKPHQFSIGVAIDASYYALFGSSAAVKEQVTAIFAASNMVYLNQLKLFLTISDIIIYTSTVGTNNPKWNEISNNPGSSQCSTSIDSKLQLFSSWRKSTQSNRNGLWHLLTNCYPPPGTVGLAYIGVLCDKTYGVGISSYSSRNWITSAHEIGHAAGASHTFQLGVGSTGGIMDYGDGKLSGEYQFNTAYSKSEICNEITSQIKTTGFTPFCFTEYNPTCGNGIVELNEECDDNSLCCNQATCKLTVGSRCSIGNSGECCNSKCQFVPTSISCKNNLGYCSNGQCRDSICNSYSSLYFCGTNPQNPCKQQCKTSATGTCTDRYTTPNMNVVDGSFCRNDISTGINYICKSGQCIANNTINNIPIGTIPINPIPADANPANLLPVDTTAFESSQQNIESKSKLSTTTIAAIVGSAVTVGIIVLAILIYRYRKHQADKLHHQRRTSLAQLDAMEREIQSPTLPQSKSIIAAQQPESPQSPLSPTDIAQFKSDTAAINNAANTNLGYHRRRSSAFNPIQFHEAPLSNAAAAGTGGGNNNNRFGFNTGSRRSSRIVVDNSSIEGLESTNNNNNGIDNPIALTAAEQNRRSSVPLLLPQSSSIPPRRPLPPLPNDADAATAQSKRHSQSNYSFFNPNRPQYQSQTQRKNSVSDQV